jgi:hypothetical protein
MFFFYYLYIVCNVLYHVHFCFCAQVKPNMAASSTDQSGWYTVDCGKAQYTLPVRYQDPVPVGQGAFGVVM